jgi:hypothetical protein
MFSEMLKLNSITLSAVLLASTFNISGDKIAIYIYSQQHYAKNLFHLYISLKSSKNEAHRQKINHAGRYTHVLP